MNPNSRFGCTFVAAIFSVLVIWCVPGILFGDSSMQIGDLFSGLAFAALIITLVIQNGHNIDLGKKLDSALKKFSSQTDKLQEQVGIQRDAHYLAYAMMTANHLYEYLTSVKSGTHTGEGCASSFYSIMKKYYDQAKTGNNPDFSISQSFANRYENMFKEKHAPKYKEIISFIDKTFQQTMTLLGENGKSKQYYSIIMNRIPPAFVSILMCHAVASKKSDAISKLLLNTFDLDELTFGSFQDNDFAEFVKNKYQEKKRNTNNRSDLSVQ